KLEAARGCRELGRSVLLGPPNSVRGGSHSAILAAASLARNWLLDILSSDYYPASLLQDAIMLAEQDNDCRLPQAINMV
ncbi:alpha-D-ribose 1-methylphosphonate 5-triphosphate diphosphatase, partial [Pseudomonas syringae pv. tagetis]